MLITTEGIVLKQNKIANNRRMIVVFTKDYGKISAGTGLSERGRNRSALALRPFTYSEYEIFKIGTITTSTERELSAALFHRRRYRSIPGGIPSDWILERDAGGGKAAAANLRIDPSSSWSHYPSKGKLWDHALCVFGKKSWNAGGYAGAESVRGLRKEARGLRNAGVFLDFRGRNPVWRLYGEREKRRGYIDFQASFWYSGGIEIYGKTFSCHFFQNSVEAGNSAGIEKFCQNIWNTTWILIFWKGISTHKRSPGKEEDMEITLEKSN